MHLDVHPTHEGKRSTTRAMHPSTLDLKKPPEEVLVGFYPKEGLVDDHKAHQLEQTIEGEMLQLDARLLKKSLEKIQCQDPKLALMEIGEGHHFPRSQVGEHLTGGVPSSGDPLRREKTLIDEP